MTVDRDILALVDADDRLIGTTSKLDAHFGEGQRHRAFSLFVIRCDGRVLIQRRSSKKPLWPLFWANACCSHPHPEENPEESVVRRAHEELGLLVQHPQLLFKFEYHAVYGDHGAEHEVCSVFLSLASAPTLHPNPLEVDGYDWCTPEEIDQLVELHADRCAPWFLIEWPRVRGLLSATMAA